MLELFRITLNIEISVKYSRTNYFNISLLNKTVDILKFCGAGPIMKDFARG